MTELESDLGPQSALADAGAVFCSRAPVCGLEVEASTVENVDCLNIAISSFGCYQSVYTGTSLSSYTSHFVVAQRGFKFTEVDTVVIHDDAWYSVLQEVSAAGDAMYITWTDYYCKVEEMPSDDELITRILNKFRIKITDGLLLSQSARLETDPI